MQELISIILGGGAGSRLYPLTARRSKPAVPLAGKYRLIDIPISNSINSGINRILVLTQYNSASLNSHISRSYRFDQFRNGGVSVLAAEQTPDSKDWFQGTADAVRQSMSHVKPYRYKGILILSGDQLYQMDYRKMYQHHQDLNADITIATIPVDANDATGFGILKTDANEVITDFHEKPSTEELDGLESKVSEKMEQQQRVYLASMGIYIFNRSVLDDELLSNPEAHDFGKEIIPGSIEKYKVVSYPFEGYWSDIGTIRSFFDANLSLARQGPEFNMYDPDHPVFTNARILPPAKIQSSFIQDSMIAEAAVILDSHISNSVIGIRSYIGPNTTIKNSVVMGADYYRWHSVEERIQGIDGPSNPGIGANSTVENAIIDRNASIGNNCIIKNQHMEQHKDGEDGLYFIRDGIVIIPKNVVIQDGTII